MRNSTLIIAEAGVNHNGDMDLAKKLIQAASNAGADLVKFQTFKATALVTESARLADYQKASMEGQNSQFELLQDLELGQEQHLQLIRHCNEFDIGFLSTAFDLHSVDLLSSLGLSLYKIPSGELTNLPYLKHIGQMGGEIILSTGMGTLAEVKEAVGVLEQSGAARSDITVLHCTSEYPAPMKDVNLRAMQAMGEALGVRIGYSDHTLGIEVPIAAVALGATVIEKHITLDRSLRGPDHKASLEPTEFGVMVRCIRNLEIAMGDGVKRPTGSEIGNREVVRKSLVAASVIKAGDLFSSDNLTTKRPGTGISPMQWDEIVGTRSPRDFSKDELIEL